MSRKKSIWNRLGRIAEHGITKAVVRVADRLPDAWLKNQIKQRKADQVYTHAQETHEKAIERKEQLIEKAALQNTKTQKQIDLADIRIEKEKLKLEKMKSKR